MMEKFTPGPWNWESQNGRVLSRHKRKGTTGGCTHNSIYAICNLDDGEYIVYEDEAELEANARLIVAAPDMYSALKEAMRHIPKDYDDQLKAREMINALLARIDGKDANVPSREESK